MHITGTTYLMDLWADLQMRKAIVKKPLSEEAKKELIDIYDEYKRLGGTKTDHQVEEWKKGNENMKKNYLYKVQELSTGEVGERGVNYEIEKTKIVSCVNGFVTSGLMKINNIIMEDYHEQDCCEHVYADFSALEDTTFFDELKGKNLTAKEVANNIELVEGTGFRIFGYFVPCYNVQDGYYSNNLTLIITEEHGKNKIEIDLTNCTSWRDPINFIGKRKYNASNRN